MSLRTKEMKSAGSRVEQPNITPDVYPSRLVQVIELGLQPREPYQGTPKAPCYQAWVTFEIPDLFMVDKNGEEDKERPRWVSKKVNILPLSQEKAISTQWMNALDPTGVADGDWSRILGNPCGLQIINREFKGKTYDNIGSVSPLMRGITVSELMNEPVYFDIDTPDMEIYGGLPDFLKEIMAEGVNFSGSTLERAIGGDTSVKEVVELADDEAPY